MRALVQRVTRAQVTVDNKIIGKIAHGLLIFLGVTHDDKDEDIDWLSKKILALRIFSDENGKMNLSLMDSGGDALIISQFTLFASTKKGNRPSYIRSAPPEIAEGLYERFKEKLSLSVDVESGKFGGDMKVDLLNDGPVTILLDSKNREI